MASTFAELMSDFTDATKSYAESLDVTELSFMRMLTRGMQKFQRDTEYIEAMYRMTRDPVNAYYLVPDDMIRPIMITDKYDVEVITNGITQGQRTRELQRTRFSRVPRVHDYLLNTTAQIATLHDRKFIITSDRNEDYYLLHYVPDIQAISENSRQWTAWFPTETAFMNMFNTSKVHDSIAPYEGAFVDFAIAQYIKSKGSPNYVVYENAFKSEVKQAILNKPTLDTQMARDYFLAPYS